MKRYISVTALALSALILMSLCGCGGSGNGESTTSGGTTTFVDVPPASSDTGTAAVTDTSGETVYPPESSRDTHNATGVLGTGDETNEIVYDDGTIHAVVTLQKTGDNVITDDRENKYIKAIVEKYKVNPAFLVAIYTEPESDNNIVLEFDGTLKDDGTYLRSPDNLARLYTITADLKIEKAEADVSIRNIKKWFSVQLAKGLIMEQHPDIFDIEE